MSTLTEKIAAAVAEYEHPRDARITEQDLVIAKQVAAINEHRALQVQLRAEHRTLEAQLRAELYEQKKANAEMAAFVKAVLAGAQNTSKVLQSADNAEVKRISEQLGAPVAANGKPAKRPSLRERLHLNLPAAEGEPT